MSLNVWIMNIQDDEATLWGISNPLPSDLNTVLIADDSSALRDRYLVNNSLQKSPRYVDCIVRAVQTRSAACVEILLTHKPENVNLNDRVRSSKMDAPALHYAISLSDKSIVTLLLQGGANIYIVDSKGVDCIDVVKTMRKTVCKQEFIEVFDLIITKRNEIERAVVVACTTNDIETLKGYLSQVVNIKHYLNITSGRETLFSSVLFTCCRLGHLACVEYLIELGGMCLPNLVGETPLYIACKFGHHEILKLLLMHFPETVSLPTTENNRLPLHVACVGGFISIVDTLLNFSYPESSMNKIVFDYQGQTRDYSFPFNLDQEDTRGWTPLLLALRHKHTATAHILITMTRLASPVHQVNEEGSGGEIPGPLGGEMTLVYPTLLCGENVRRALHLSVKLGNLPLTEALLRHLPVHEVNTTCFVALDDTTELVETRSQADRAQSPLHIAFIERQDEALVDLLLRSGASDSTNELIAQAQKEHRLEAVNCFLRYEAYPDRQYMNCESCRQLGLTPVSLQWADKFLTKERFFSQWIENATRRYNLNHLPALLYLCITQVDLSNNKFDFIPEILYQMTSLRELTLNNTGLIAMDDANLSIVELLGGWSQMTRLSLTHNKLTGVPNWLFSSKLPQLSYLNLAHNRLENLPFRMWATPALRHLDLSHNQLRVLPHAPTNKPHNTASYLGKLSNSLSQLMTPSGRHTYIGSFKSESSVILNGCSVYQAKDDNLTSIMSEDGDNFSLDLLNDEVFDDYDTDYTIQTPEDLAFQHRNWHQSGRLTVLPDQSSFSASTGGENGRRGSSNTIRRHLQVLILAYNALSEVPLGLACLAPQLHTLDLSNNRIVWPGKTTDYPVALIHLFLNGNQIRSLNYLTTSHHRNMDEGADEDQEHAELDKCYAVGRQLRLNVAINRGGSCPHRSTIGGYRGFPKLKVLVLHSNKLKEIGTFCCMATTVTGNKDMCLFPLLTSLDISKNPELTSLPEDTGALHNLSHLNIESTGIEMIPRSMYGLSFLKGLKITNTPLENYLAPNVKPSSSPLEVLSFLQTVSKKGKVYNKVKVMVVGKQSVGKTTLLQALRSVEQSGGFMSWFNRVEGKPPLSTVGVDISEMPLQRSPGVSPKTSRATSDPPVQRTHASSSLSETDVGEEDRQQPVGIILRTWDFGGQREYYATHQYFLTRKSIYLVVWRFTEGEKGLDAVKEWLVNIQSCAPGATVFLVGTYLDEVPSYANRELQEAYIRELRNQVFERFMNHREPNRMGLPVIQSQLEVSCTELTGIRKLADEIYRAAKQLTIAVPSIYIDIEKAIGKITTSLKENDRPPILSSEEFRAQIRHYLPDQRDNSELNHATDFLHEKGVLLHYHGANLRDRYFLDPQWLCNFLSSIITVSEIQKWVKSGVLETHRLGWILQRYKEAATQLEPVLLELLEKFELAIRLDVNHILLPNLLPSELQCCLNQYRGQRLKKIRVQSMSMDDNDSSDIMRNGLFPVEDVEDVEGRGQRTPSISTNIHLHDHRRVDHFFLNSLSLNEQQNSLSPASEVTKLLDASPTNTESTQSQFYKPLPRSEGDLTTQPANRGSANARSSGRSDSASTTGSGPIQDRTGDQHHSSIQAKPTPENMVFRVYAMAYIPNGFWPRLITKLLTDKNFHPICKKLYSFADNSLPMETETSSSIQKAPYWIPWQTGIELFVCDQLALSIKQVQDEVQNRVEYASHKYIAWIEGEWTILTGDLKGLFILEVYIPGSVINYQEPGEDSIKVLNPNRQAIAQLITRTVDHIDSLIEDWYPDLGERLGMTTDGQYLVTRLMPCTHCLLDRWTTKLSPQDREEDGANQAPLTGSGGSWSLVDSSLGQAEVVSSVRIPAGTSPLSEEALDESIISQEYVYCLTVEEYIRGMLQEEIDHVTHCPVHPDLEIPAPDLCFQDLPKGHCVASDHVRLTRFLSRGAFGSVFAGMHREGTEVVDVAVKILVPIDPGPNASERDKRQYEKHLRHWNGDAAVMTTSAAYIQVRRELDIFFRVSGLPGLIHCQGVLWPNPLGILLPLAPLGSLNKGIEKFAQSVTRIPRITITEILMQTATGLSHLHRLGIIYRDLKSENILVWSLPTPAEASGPLSQLPTALVKLTDYGISRLTVGEGGKGLAGTEPYIAPEILEHRGELIYRDKVDIYSFGVFIYELLTLKLPFEDHTVPWHILERNVISGERPEIHVKDTNYPSGFLDLMCLCWASNPNHRPSSTEICRSIQHPGFPRIKDVFLVNHITKVTCVHVDDCVSDTSSRIWMGGIFHSGQHVAGRLMAFTVQGGWVTAAQLVAEWPADKRDLVYPQTLAQLSGFTSCPDMRVVCCGLNFGLIYIYNPHDFKNLQIQEIFYEFRTSFLLLTPLTPQGPLLIVLDNGESVFFGGRNNLTPSDVTTLTSGAITGAVYLEKASELWLGGTHTSITAFRYNAAGNQLTLQAQWHHPCLAPTLNTLATCRLAADETRGQVWTYVYPGTTIYCWSVRNRQLLHQVSLTNISIPLTGQASTIGQVRCLRFFCGHLFIGTTLGYLAIIKPIATDNDEGAANSPALIYCCRCHGSDEDYVAHLSEVTGDREGNRYLLSIGRGWQDPLQPLLVPVRRPSEVARNENYSEETYIITWFADSWFDDVRE